MVFALSKVFWLVARPGDLLVIVLAVGVVRLWLSRGRRGRALVTVAALGFAAVMILPLGDWLIRPLEARFPPPAVLPPRIAGIILLGGAVDVDVTAAHGQVALNGAAERVTATLALARRYPAAPVLVSGGNGEILSAAHGEAGPTARLLVEDGLDRGRLLIEDRSHTTYENALFSRALARPQPGAPWILVTSAAHMPRAVGCFRHVGWPDLLPFPVDYRSGRAFVAGMGLRSHLAVLDFAVHEWIGLVAYRLLGRIDSVFPGPIFPGPAVAAPVHSAMSAR